MSGWRTLPMLPSLDFAKENGFALVSIDADFVDLNTIIGVPPKIIWLRTGNLTTRSIAKLMDKHLVAIQDFLEDEISEILELGNG